jgi:predicted transcriptional regulator
MTTVTLDISDDVAAALLRRSHESNMTIQELSKAVLEQWFFDQEVVGTNAWSPEDIAAIEAGRGEAKAGLTIPNAIVFEELFAKVR